MTEIIISMKIIDINSYSLAPWGASAGIEAADFIVRKGEVIAVTLEIPDDGHLFLRALATLVYPLKGQYYFQGSLLTFNDYRKLLAVKRKIGYVGADAALISNRTLFENLLFMRYYFENTMAIQLNEEVASLCRQCGLSEKLEFRPASLNPLDIRLAIYIRELAKKPEVLLLDRPEDIMIPSENYKGLISHFSQLISTGLPVVMISYDPGFIDKFATKVIQIRSGRIEENPFGNIEKET